MRPRLTETDRHAAPGIRFLRLAAIILGLLLLAACGGGGGSATWGSAGTPPPPPPPPSANFSLSVPATISINQGASGTLPITIQRQGDPGTITFGLSGSSLLVAGTSGAGQIGYAFTPNGDNETLTLVVGSGVPTGVYNLTVAGKAGSASHTASFALTVIARPTGQDSFSVTVQAAVSLRQGGITTVAVGISGDGFVDGTLALSSPTSLSLSGTARLHGNDTGKLGYSFESVGTHGGNMTLYVGPDVPAGSYAMTVTASAGGESHGAQFTLHVLARGTVYEIWPTNDDSFANGLKNLKSGDVLVLHQGTYPGSAVLRLNGTAEQPITIRGYGHGESKPVMQYTGSSQNHWEIRGSHLIVEGLEFDTPATYSIRIRPSDAGPVANVSLVDNTFVGCGDGCISANDDGATYSDIRIIDNLMLDALKTPVYIGNHQGTARFHNFLFEGNVIDGRSIVDTDVVGYGIEVKLNVENAVLRNNYIVGARGPGIMTYGLQTGRDPALGDIIEGNIVIGSCTDRNILIGAGPTIARRNLAMGGHSDGYGIYDYGGRHLSAGIQVLRNTSLLNEPNEFWITPQTAGTGLEDMRMTDNLAYPSAGGIGFDNLPAANGHNDIHDNNTDIATSAMATAVGQLQHNVPAPQDLKAVWPLLSQGPIAATQLASLLDKLDSLANQSRNGAPRACP